MTPTRVSRGGSRAPSELVALDAAAYPPEGAQKPTRAGLTELTT